MRAAVAVHLPPNFNTLIKLLLRNFHFLSSTICIYATEMSFGFSIGDFIAVIDLVNRVRKAFVGAPGQFRDISDEYA